MVSRIKLSQKGVTIIEVLIALLIFILVIVGFMKGYSDFLLFLKGSKINARAKELGERLRSEIITQEYSNLKDCFNSSGGLTGEGELIFNETSNETYLSVDSPDFYSENCPNFNTSNCSKLGLSCLYCYVGEELIPGNNTCEVGYPIRVGYNSTLIFYNDTENFEIREVGLALGVKIYYNEPKTKRKKEIKYLIYKRNEL